MLPDITESRASCHCGSVRFTVKLTNGSTKAVNLNQVVVTTTYGSTKQLAAPVYTESPCVERYRP